MLNECGIILNCLFSGSKSLARFYTYSSDLMEVSRIIFNRDYDWPYFRLKMMSSRSIIRDWVRGTTSKKKAMVWFIVFFIIWF